MKPGTDNKKLQVFPVNGIAGVVSTLCPRKRHETKLPDECQDDPASKPKAQAVSSSHERVFFSGKTKKHTFLSYSLQRDKTAENTVDIKTAGGAGHRKYHETLD